MVNSCPSCGGSLSFDIKSQKLKCENCSSTFLPDEYVSNTAAEEDLQAGEYTLNIHKCPNCGGTIASNEAEAVEYCLYCGSFVTLSSQMEKVKKPEYIIPFKKSKKECINSYSSMIARKLYAPKEFRDSKYLNSFKGIYIPYWTYDYKFGPNVNIEGLSQSREGDYIVKTYHDINFKTDGILKGVTFDASSSFDDDINNHILPFSSSELKPFNSSYMFGFFADTADIKSEVYHEDSDAVARDEIWKKVSKDKKISASHPQRPEKDASFNSAFKLKRASHLAMLPVWFLTWRNKDRVAYSVVNGSTGAIHSEVPLDVNRFLLFSLIFAVPIFCILNAAATFSASTMLTISVFMSLIMLILYSLQYDKIVRKLLHADDKGYIAANKDAKAALDEMPDNLLLNIVKGFKSFFKGITFWGIALVLFLVIFFWGYSFFATLLLVGFAIVYSFIRIVQNAQLIKDRTIWRDIAGIIFSLILSTIMLLCDPAGDELYYFAAIISIIGIGLSAIFTANRYNQLVTRPLPHFFDRKAGGAE